MYTSIVESLSTTEIVIDHVLKENAFLMMRNVKGDGSRLVLVDNITTEIP